VSRTWVLDTETKGTGAQMVPLEKVVKKPAPSGEPFFVPPKPRPRAPKEPEPRRPRSFKIVDVATRKVLAEGAEGRAALDVLKDVRSSVDVEVYVWAPKAERWRLLTLDEQRRLWDLRPTASRTTD
jgi:hypothetical protein